MATEVTASSDPTYDLMAALYRVLTTRAGYSEREPVDKSIDSSDRSSGSGDSALSDDVVDDLVSVLYDLRKAARDYGQFLVRAESAGQEKAAELYRLIIKQNRARASSCLEILCSDDGVGGGPRAEDKLNPPPRRP